ncbi:LytTR family DNA-binding domain-containing protein [Aquimarina sp. 2201CG5-10]|uniref:LytR/AlgR family response regulator transcription factor n=1 Tax=Aquimarina callyspongiae TaxID=3098150 RepID=UPI002AB52848|nr:LytTR family DNA-binding domain-containing protein [Aquimarina sp. 2201CG5-10]MDY8136562.1 LytTR family DNA-binding domain-containing protein [Aquimarina sp. 2201CG5-10]
MNILILEDEIPAYEKLVLYIQEYYSSQVTYDWSRSIGNAKQLLIQNQYDFILSDIQLLDGLAFDLFDQINLSSPIIFCTAYDTFLLDAFKANGIAYILKPYSKGELSEALCKYETLIASSRSAFQTNNEVFKDLKELITSEKKQFLNRFVVKKGNGIKLIDVDTISLIEACGDFCKITDKNGNTHSISQSIGILEDQLTPKSFFRINRSQIINIQHITAMDTHSKNRLLIILTGIGQGVVTSSSKTSEFRKWVQFS